VSSERDAPADAPADSARERLEDRLRSLGREKAQLQLLSHMMARLGDAVDLEQTVDSLLRCVVDHLGGANVELYYRAEGALRRADVFGAREELAARDALADGDAIGAIADPLVRRAFETGELVEVQRALTDTGVIAPSVRDQGAASAWAYPLVAAGETVGVLKIDAVQIAASDLQPHLLMFFRHAALLLQHEIRGETRLRRAYAELEASAAELRRAKGELELRVQQRTTELVAANARLAEELAERTRAEAETRASEERFRAIFEASRDAVGVSLRGIHVEANHAYRALFGVPDDVDLTGHPILEFIAPSEHARIRENVQARAVGLSVEPSYRTRGRRRDGSEFDMDVHVSAIVIDGTPHTLVILRDVSAQLQAEAALRKSQEQLRQSQKMEALGLLAGGVAHDFNNMLQAIVGFGTILRDSLDKPGDLECADELLEAAGRAAELTRGLLAFGRKQALEPKPIDLNRVVEQTRKFLVRIIGEDVSLETVLFDRPLIVEADAAQLQQVIVNLATNARDAMPGGGTLVVSTEAKTIGGAPFARVSVHDTGVGILEENLPRIFEPFFTTKEKGRGTGLGLSIVYGIVTQHGGQVQVHAAAGGGTVFEVDLPLLRRTAVEQERHEPAPRTGRGETIFIVEDDPSVRSSLHALLANAGYRVDLACDGLEAVHRFEGGARCDLVLMDLLMPQLNGRDALARIRAIVPEQPAIFMSGYTADILDVRGVASLDAPLVEKPIAPARLLSTIREVLDLSTMDGRAAKPVGER
jgi:PAS domain S-box-containing protein